MKKRPNREPREFTDVSLRKLKWESALAKDGREYEISDTKAKGLRVVLWPSGEKSLIVRYRRPNSGKSAKLSLGWIPLTAARKAAAEAHDELQHKRDPGAAKQAAKTQAASAAADTVQAVCDEYLERAGKKLRSYEQRKRHLERLVFPAIGSRPITSITKLDCIRLFDRIADTKGPVMADHIRAILGKIFNWHAGRHDTFLSPITRGIERHAKPPQERARTRTLSDDEVRRLWTATDAAGPFPALIRFLLLTGARLREAAELPHAEVNNGDWLLPAERNKVKRELLRPLSPQARDILDRLPVVSGCDYYFTAGRHGPMKGFAKAKQRLVQDSGVTGWRLHDLRRTARSLMSRAGVIGEHAEQCLGHVVSVVRGTYDRHDYYNEKKRAFEKLATQLELIVNQPDSNVVALRG